MRAAEDEDLAVVRPSFLPVNFVQRYYIFLRYASILSPNMYFLFILGLKWTILSGLFPMFLAFLLCFSVVSLQPRRITSCRYLIIKYIPLTENLQGECILLIITFIAFDNCFYISVIKRILRTLVFSFFFVKFFNFS